MMSSSNQIQPLRRSARLATVTPASYWTSIGYGEEVAQAMERLQNDMKNLHGPDQLTVSLLPRDAEGNEIGDMGKVRQRVE